MPDGQVVYKIKGDNSQFQESVKETEGIASRGFANIGKATAVAVGAASAAVAGFAASAVGVGANFDKSMAQVAATMGVTVDEIGELRDFAQEMGANTAFSANQAADALNYMALAGYDAQTSMEMLPNVLNLAAAGGIELARASDMVTDAQTALGLSLEETSVMVDQMAKASSKSNTSVAQLGDAILTIGGNAKTLKGGTQELTQVLGLLADNGIKGSEAGTHLRNILLALNPTTEDACYMFKALGLNAYDAEGEMRPLADVFGELQEKVGDLSSEERADILGAMFNKTDLAAVNALLDTSAERWGELGLAIDDAAGSAEQMANTQLDNLTGDITLFQSALEGAKIKISDGLTPTLREFVGFGTEAIGTLSTAFEEGGLSGAMDALGTILSEGLNLIVQELPTFVDAGMQLLGSLAEGILENLPTLVETALELVVSLADDIADAIPEMIPTIVLIMLTIVDTLINNVDKLVDASLKLIIALAVGLIQALPELIKKAPEIIISLVDALISNIPKVVGAGQEILRGLLDAIEGMIQDFFDIGGRILEGLKNGIVSKATALKDSVVDAVSGAWGAAKRFLGINSPSKLFMEMGGYIDEGLAQGITREAESPATAVQNMVAGLIPSIDMPSASMTTTNIVNNNTTSMVGGNQRAVMMIDKRVLGELVYDLNNSESQQVGVVYGTV